MQFTKKDLDIVFKYVTERLIREKLSDFPDAEVLTGREIIPVIQGGENRNMKTKNILDIPQVSDKFSSCDSKLENKAAELQNQIDSLEIAGIAVSNEFGNNEHISISQAVLTKAVNAIWKKLAEITGEPTTGIALTVTPDYFISDDECTVHISAEHETHVFEKILFYADDELLAEAENVKEFSHDATISKTCTIKCVATILGMEYTDTKKVTKYFPFFIGCGTSWEDMISEKFAREYKGTIHGNYDIEVENTGDRIYIITPASLEDEFNGAFMNGFEIPFQIINNTQYVIRESRNTYTKGIYNIDIN